MKNSNYIKLKNIFLFVSLIYLTLLIPFLITIYSNSWYEFNYNMQDITSEIKPEVRINATNNLIYFFKYKEELNGLWNEKEKKHMDDVREIYLKLIQIGIFLTLILIFLFNKELLLKYSKINIYILFSLFILIPFFTIIFSGIFHTIIFENNYWMINSNDISYYLFPVEFFRNSFIFILITTIIENILIYIYFSKYNKIKTHIYK